MVGGDKCRVDGCDRNAASSMIRESLPGPLRLCATHTEDYRLNSSGWNIIWDPTSPEPTSVTAAAVAPVGHFGPRPTEPSVTGARPSLTSRLTVRRKKRP